MRRVIYFIAFCLCLAGQVRAQERTITGKVSDAQGTPLQNASVIIKGQSAGTATGTDGTYSISIPSSARTLVFSSVGLAPVEIAIGNKGVINVSLAVAEKGLQEVVIVGYGTQKRAEINGSSATVKGSAIADKPVQSFEAALAGRAAGVQITVPNGVVNAPPVFNIRGINSITQSSYPLIVVDGVASFTGDIGSTSASTNPLASINPNDIESVTIAKDAAATAIYGSRAANGVVFVTTKKGHQGKALVGFDSWLGSSEKMRLPKLLNAFQYTDYKNVALQNNPGVNPAYHFALTNDASGKPINTNWYDVVYRRSFSQSHNVNVTGGNENTTYYLSAGYTDQEGIIRRNGFVRKNMLLNVDSRPNKYFAAGAKLAYSNENNLAATTSGSLSGEAYNTGGLARTALLNAPSIAPYNNDGSFNLGDVFIGSMNNTLPNVGLYNPSYLLQYDRSNNEINHIQPNLYFQVKPLDWMTLRTVYGLDFLLINNDAFNNPNHGDGQGSTGEATSSSGTYKSWVWTNTVQFDHSFGSHNLSLLAGNEQNRTTSTAFGIDRQNLSDPTFDVVQAGFTINSPTGLVLGEHYLLSSFSRLNYDYDKKYFVTGNIRQDEYSALGKKKGIFWGASAGWEITKENFWVKMGLDKVFSSFKIRGSYGKVGNTGGISDYVTYSTFSAGLYNGNSTFYYSGVGNPELKWETSTKTDGGLSFGILKNRLTAELTYYNNDINELILNVPQAPSSGLPSGSTSSVASVPANSGKMYNRGFELTLSGTPVQERNFSWNSSFNLTVNSNKVTALAPGLTVVQTATSGSEIVNETVVGKSIGYLWVVRTAGVDPASGRRIFLNSAGQQVLFQFYAPAGQNKWSMQDGTAYKGPGGASAISSANDAVLYKNTLPRIYGGFANTFHYGNFDLDVLLTYQMGFYVYYGTNAGLHDQRFWNNTTDVLKFWAKPGDKTAMPRPVYGDNISNGSTGMPLDIDVFKGDFIKLKNVSLAYNLPVSLLGRYKISSLKVYISGQNLAVKTKYPGPDPEVSSNGASVASGQGVDRNTGPNARTITMGMHVGF